MRAAGCRRVYVGIESGSQKVLDYLKRGYELEKVMDNLRQVRASGLEMVGWFIVGSPVETPEDFELSLKLARDLKLEFIAVSTLVPYPNTELYELEKDNIDFSLLPYVCQFKDQAGHRAGGRVLPALLFEAVVFYGKIGLSGAASRRDHQGFAGVSALRGRFAPRSQPQGPAVSAEDRPLQRQRRLLKSAGPRLSVAVPCYNEEAIIEASYRRIKDTCEAQGVSYEIIFGNDGSTDATLEMLEAIAAADPPVRVTSHFPNRGAGFTYREMYGAARGEIIIQMDCDLAMPVEVAIPAFLDGAEERRCRRRLALCRHQGRLSAQAAHLQPRLYDADPGAVQPERGRYADGLHGLLQEDTCRRWI